VSREYSDDPAESEGRLEFFTLPGFHPKYGTKLAPATSEVIAEYEKQKAQAERQRQAAQEQEHRKAQDEAHRKARQAAEAKRQKAAKEKAIQAALTKRPLRPGRYIFFSHGTICQYRFTLNEIDLTP
jgi:hypothetical protein